MLRILVCLICVVLSVLPAARAADLEPLRIGVVLPLSGPSASLGNYIKNGVELAYDGLAEESQAQVEIIFEDDAWKTAAAVSAFQKLVNVKKVHAVLGVGSAVGNALAPLAEQRKLPFISIGASDQKVVAGRTFAFIHWVTPEVEARVMAEEIVRRGYQRLAVIGTEHEGVLAVLSAVDKAFAERDLSDKVVLRQTFLASETNFQTYLAKIRLEKVDGIVVCLLPGSLASFAKQSKQQGVAADLMGVELFEDENEVKAAAGGLDGQWYVNADTASTSFEAAYRKKYGSHPGWASANAFDATNLLVNALREGDGDSQKVAEYLSTVKDYKGAAGTYSGSGDNRFTLPATVKIVTKDGFKKISDS